MEKENKLKKLRSSILNLQMLRNMLRKLACIILGCSVLSYLGYLLSKLYVLAIIHSASTFSCFMFIGLSGLIDIVSLIVECTYKKTIQVSR